MEKFDPQQYAENELERFSLRIPHKLKEELSVIAQQNNMSLNNLITRCIEFALRNMSKK